jgi:glycogen debranching enzyme
LLRYRHTPGTVALAERLALVLLDAAEVFGVRLPELYCGLPRSQFSSPVPCPTSCSPQAWASAAPLLLLRSFLGLDPHVPHKNVTVCPQLPTEWGGVTLTDLALGAITVRFEAEGETVKTLGVPDDWQLLTPAF